MDKNKVLNVILISLLIAIIIVLIIINIDFYNKKVMENTYRINLLGLQNITIYEGEIYNEAGFIAYDYNSNDVTSMVKVNGNVNSNLIGTYEIIYSINSFFKKNEVKRIVNVLEDPLKDITFSLKGNSYIEFNLNDTYTEFGFTCFDRNNLDCSNNVTINSNVLMNKIGSYTIDYVLKIGNKEKKLTRIVGITGQRYAYKLDKENLVNTDVVIQFQSNINNLDYIVNPKGEKVSSDIINYSVSTNGNYKFVMYDKNGISTEILVKVDNIDKEAPTGSCKAIIDGNSTTYTIEAQDNNKISKYIHDKYPNNPYYDSNFEIDGSIEEGSILVYDEASNYTKVICDTNYAYIGISESSIYEYNSETLKYWIEKINSDYYIAHIWMDDPYNQLKTALPSSFGTLLTAKSILNNEINVKGYSNKGMVALNGSAFVSSEFDQNFYQKISAWKNTAVTPIVIHNDNVLRNFTNQVLPNNQYFTYGLTKFGNLKYYSFENVNDVSTNQKTSQQIIDDGVKYTFGFRPILVWNSAKVVNDSSKEYKRQALGQIDKNNFVVISTSDVSLNSIANKMLSLGCHTGFNLDGGGSIGLFYKANNNQLITLKDASREIADVLYFVEN